MKRTVDIWSFIDFACCVLSLPVTINLTSFCFVLHDKSKNTKPSKMLIEQKDLLERWHKPSVVVFLGVELDSVLRELKMFMNNKCQFPNSSFLSH